MDLLAIALFGLGFGALYAGIGMGVVLVHRSSGVVNIGQVAFGMWGAFVANELHSTGRLFLPWVGLPSVVTFPGPLSGWASLVIGSVCAAALGAAAFILVLRPLRRASQLARVVATVGVLLTVQALIVLQFGTQTRTPGSLLPGSTTTVGTLEVPTERLTLAAVTVVLGVALGGWQRRSLLGIALRAGAENEPALALAGWSASVTATLGWALAAFLTSVLAVLASSSVSLSPSTFPALLVPGLACAMVGRLASFVGTSVAGLALGAIQSATIFITATPQWPVWARAGLADALPFLVVVAVLALRGKALPERGAFAADRLPAPPAKPPRWLGVGATLLGAGLLVVTDGGLRFALIITFVMGLFTLSIVVVTGLTGQLSLAQAAIAGVAAFVMVKVTPAVPFPLNVVVGVAGAVLAGTLVGLPALRIRGSSLAVVTLSAAVAVEAFVFNNTAMNPPERSVLPPPMLGGLSLSVREGDDIARLPFGIVALSVLVTAAYLVMRLTHGRWGRRFLAVRSDERAAAASGVPVAQTKLTAFAISSALAGCGGVLLAYVEGQAGASSFAVFVGLSFIVYAYLGGITSVTGAIVGAVMAPGGLAFVALSTWIDLGQWYALISGLGLLVAIVQNPSGVTGAVRDALSRVRRESIGQRRGEWDVEVAGSPAPPALGSPRVSAGPGEAATVGPREWSRVVLDAEDVRVRYGGVVAVDGVSIQVRAGEIVGLIGANGAGKSSLVDALTGFVPSTGTLTVDGDATLTACRPDQRYRRGLARTWQSPSLVADLSVWDNVATAACPVRPGDLARDLFSAPGPKEARRVNAVLSRVGATGLARRSPAELSTGPLRTAGLARAIAHHPLVLLADEPAAGLSAVERSVLEDSLRGLAHSGVGVLVIEHDIDLVLRICDRVVVLDLGRVIASGPPEAVRNDPVVVAAYLGVLPGGSVTGQDEGGKR